MSHEGKSETAERLTLDEARELKRLAQSTFGYAGGDRRLRQDLGLEDHESLTLRHLAAHVTRAVYAAVMAAYTVEVLQAGRSRRTRPCPANGQWPGTRP